MLLGKMLFFFRYKSKFRYRSGSNDFAAYGPLQSNTEKINIYMTSLFMALFTGLSGPYGICMLATFGIVWGVIGLAFYLRAVKDDIYEVAMNFKRISSLKLQEIKSILNAAISIGNKIEREFLKLNNISTTICQIVFFTTCEKVLIPNQSVTALYSLMFYNVISYCISYLKEMLSQSNWSPYINIANHSTIKHLAMSATKIVLEITKAVTFVITLMFMLFVLCLEQRMHYYQPTKLFTFFTILYFLASEKTFAEAFPSLLSYFEIRGLENLETLWAPVLLTVVCQILSFGFAIALFLRGLYRASLVTIYLNVYLPYKKLLKGSWKVLNDEKALVTPFRYATTSELEAFEDVCAVCLNNMQVARITPCHHIFHTDCLRQCLLTCDKCPVCKRELKFY